MPAANELLETIQKNGVKFIQLQFVDINGVPKSCEIPAERLGAILEEGGLWFDGSSIEGFARVCESDMFLKPDLSTYVVFPWNKNVAQITCDIYKDERTPHEGCTRGLLKRHLLELKKKGIEYHIGAELEFFLFKDPPVDNEKLAHSDSSGYFDAGPRDPAEALKRELIPILNSLGFDIEMTHHECAPSQHELDFRYGGALRIADAILTIKIALKTLAKKHGLYASFMPKPQAGIAGSGMHTHQSLWKFGKNIFYDPAREYFLSNAATSFLAGQLEHAREISAILSPTVNSYKRLVPGHEAPVYVCWGQVNRSALIRIPKAIESKRASATRLELRSPDPSCNPYLAFAVMLAAGLDGIKKKLQPPLPTEENVYQFDEARLKTKGIAVLPGSLAEALDVTQQSKFVQAALGPLIFDKLIESGRKQWQEYHSKYLTQVSSWELEQYLNL